MIEPTISEVDVSVEPLCEVYLKKLLGDIIIIFIISKSFDPQLSLLPNNALTHKKNTFAFRMFPYPLQPLLQTSLTDPCCTPDRGWGCMYMQYLWFCYIY